MANAEIENFPKKKSNKTIIITNSTMRKYNVNSKSSFANYGSNSSKPREHPDYTEPSTSKHFLTERQISPSNATLMDSSNKSNNTMPTISTLPLIPDDKESTQFLFNFESKNEAGNRKSPECPYGQKHFRMPSKGGNLVSAQREDDRNQENIVQDINSIHAPSLIKKYENIDMNTIYPEELDALFPPFGIQQRFRRFWYCLVCDLKVMSFRTLKRHVASDKHGNAAESKRLKLNSYIDFWTAQPEDCKKYQISFNIGKGRDILRCTNCFMNIKGNLYIDHMLVCKIKKPKKHVKRKKHLPDMENANIGKKSVENVVSEVALVETENTVTDPNANAENVSETKLEKVLEKTSELSPRKTIEKKKKKQPVRKSHQVYYERLSSQWTKIIEGLPARFDRHFKFLKKLNNDIIECKACEMDIDLDIIALLGHLASKDHHIECGIFKVFWTFICCVCDVECKSECEFWSHRNMNDKHKEKVHELLADNPYPVGEYSCGICKIIMFGQEADVNKHIEAPVQARRAENVIPVPTELDEAVINLFKSRSHIECTAVELLDVAKEVKELDYQVTEIIEDLENTLRCSFPNVKAYPFGSRITGICNKDSDLDIYVDIDSVYHGNRVFHQTDVIKQMNRILAANKQTWNDIFAIPAARTPLITLRHIPTKIDIDLSFQNGLSVENTKFLRFCVELQPKLRPLILLLKAWNTTAKLKPRFTTYAMCMMAIFKLQLDGHLIPVSYLRQLNDEAAKVDAQQLRSKEYFVTGWRIIHYRLSIEQMQQYVVPITCDVSDLLKSFFEYYAAFDYTKLICPLLGEVVDMEEWFEDNVSILPDEMDSYKDKVFKGVIRHNMFGYRYPLTLQDPFDMSHNLTKNVKRVNLKVWRALCQLTFDYLTKQ